MTPQHPFDLHSHLAWLLDRELKENAEVMRKNKISEASPDAQLPAFELGISIGKCKAFREVIDHIEQQPKELHRCMVPLGWEEV